MNEKTKKSCNNCILEEACSLNENVLILVHEYNRYFTKRSSDQNDFIELKNKGYSWMVDTLADYCSKYKVKEA